MQYDMLGVAQLSSKGPYITRSVLVEAHRNAAPLAMVHDKQASPYACMRGQNINSASHVVRRAHHGARLPPPYALPAGTPLHPDAARLGQPAFLPVWWNRGSGGAGLRLGL
ncbi:hypothetical protein GUJ93_ZPchr0011g27409 [Zizania palustris]|uniref:Uncharacterized protein n=1 Tax=Zizania palustris TaxID=103762 RepID=A0A8J5WHP5_ZIZPA|nr:hypothetical protein GUJ93_ZPchr0011g27409 [Zizania palustris]